MVASLNVNPMRTSNAAGSFNIQSLGLIQGTAYDSPNSRFNLAGGVLNPTEALPMWGGVGISETTAPATTALINPAPDLSLGGVISRATQIAAGAGMLTGFSVFDQAHSMINTPQGQVPVALANMSVHFYRLGSGARIAVAIDPSLVNLEGNVITQNVSWDFNNQRLQPYVASGATIGITSITWSSTAGGRGAVVAAAPVPFGLGDVINISGATNTGTGGAAAVNGNFTIDTYTDSTHFTIAMPAAAGVIGTIAGTIVINVGIGALPVKVLEVDMGNSMIVSYDPVTGFVNWNRSGNAAVILI